MLSPAANSTLDIRDRQVILLSSEHEESEQSVSRSRRLTVQDNSAASDILELLSEIEDSDQPLDVSDESERAGRAAADLVTNIVLSADFRCEGIKVSCRVRVYNQLHQKSCLNNHQLMVQFLVINMIKINL